MSERKSQRDLIAKHFDQGGSLTVLEAIRPPFNCYALSQRCGNLLRDGYPVKKENVRLSNGKWIKRYSKQDQ